MIKWYKILSYDALMNRKFENTSEIMLKKCNIYHPGTKMYVIITNKLIKKM